MGHVADILAGAAAMASLSVALFFLKFWQRTRDSLFLLFAGAFAVDALARLALSMVHVSDAAEPIYFLPRLVMFALIAIAVINKNARGSGG